MAPDRSSRRRASSTGPAPTGGARRRGRRTVAWSRSATPASTAPAAPRWSTWPAGWSLPGFVDAHVHPVQGGLERIRCDLSEARTRARTTSPDRREYAAAHPDLPWILGGGWAMAAFPGGTPTAADLDAVVPDRPVFLPNRDHHGAWVNTRALELAGIDAAHPRPADGRIERDADGRPTGTLHEGAMALVRGCCPPTTERGVRRGAARRPGLPALARRDRAGRTRSSGRTPAWTTPAGVPPRGRRSGDLHRHGGRRAVVGPRARRWSRCRTWSSGGSAYHPRAVPGDER